ncbi:MAG: AAA family ATPase [Lachnospiraceae bacterium]|nr:AAA family ATPase [Lachnospiraceae bacterium]
MKDIFITKLTLEKVRNLDCIEIPLSEKNRKHLIFTGKNGSGKTTILKGLSIYLNGIATTDDLSRAQKNLLIDKRNFESAKERKKPQVELLEIEKRIQHYEQRIWDIKRGFDVEMSCPQEEVHFSFEAGEFVIAYYKAERIFTAEAPKHVEKVALKENYSIYENPRTDFVKYLLDLKMTQALSQTSKKREKADGIQQWFDNFEALLQDLFENKELRLEFDEETFRFTIQEPEKEPYDFNTLSSGYAAALDIVVDLMIRMEKQTERKFQYNMPGIVLIDEIETHLHLELQKKILRLLTTMFPKIQFIVTTHSPFILNSLDQAVIYDLEQHLLVENGLADIPYDGIVEGYFGADVLSDKLKEKFGRYQTLVQKESLTDDDFEEITNLEMFLDEIPDYLALRLTTEYQRLKLELSKREDLYD